MSTLTRTNAAQLAKQNAERNAQLSMADLELQQDAPTSTPEPAKPANPSMSATEAPKQTLSPLARTYIATALESVLRPPAPSLRPEYRDTLLMFRNLADQALRVNASHARALISVVTALASTSGALLALRFIRQVGQQMLWQVTVDISRDRKSAGDAESALAARLGAGMHDEVRHDADSVPSGCDPTRDQEYIPAPTEDEATEAYIEAHSWLSTVADLLPADDNERTYLQLDSGLEFTQERVTHREVHDELTGEIVEVALPVPQWRGVFSFQDALQIQLQKNEDAFKRRAARNVEAKRDAYAALARVA